jgi:type II secretory pathway component PulK
MTVVANERGVALLVTLLVVALLTITVVEFTYSVEVDQHMARSALNSLQAALLARSGINLGEALLIHDTDPRVDAFTEDWCPGPSESCSTESGQEVSCCQIDETNSQLILPQNMHLRVQIIDESGKLNINMTRPSNKNEWLRMSQTASQAPGSRPQVPVPAQTRAQVARDALAQLLAGHGGDAQTIDDLDIYWDRLFRAIYGDPGGAPGQNVPVGTPTPALPINFTLLDFPSLDDATVIPSLTSTVIRRLRPYVSALQYNASRINVNTAPQEVLGAIIGDSGVVDDIIAQRQNAPLQQVPPFTSRSGQGGGPTTNTNVSNALARTMFGVTSAYYRIKASAVVNPNPLTGRGGIRRSAEMLVFRYQSQQRSGTVGGGNNAVHWTLTQLDWQKEPGAALFLQRADQEPGTDGDTAPGTSRMGG